MPRAQAFFLGLLLTVSGSVFPAELNVLTENCDGCHGPQGVSTEGDIPTIAGQSAEFITASLESFQEHGRPCQRSTYRHGDTSKPATTMCTIASALSEEDLTALGEHYSGLPFVPAKQEFDPALAATGEQLHADGCESCHAQGGRVAGRGPILAGQWLPYLKMATEQSLNGELMVPPIMERELISYSSTDIAAVLDFFASQQE